MAPASVLESCVALATMVVSTVSRSSVEFTAWLISPSACSSPIDWLSSRVRACTSSNSRVLDRDHRLVGERRDQLDLLFGEGARLGPEQGQYPQELLTPEDRHCEHRPS